jgi:hypothetical protein
MEMTFAVVAAGLLITTGCIVFVYALFDQTRTTDIIFNMRPSVWRILMLVGGVGLVAAGGNLFVGKFWARAIGLSLATLALLAGLLHIQSDPLLSVGLIVLNLGVIYALGIRWREIQRAFD